MKIFFQQKIIFLTNTFRKDHQRYLLTLILLLSFFTAISQPQNNNWYFGSHNGLSFASGSPVNITGGQNIQMEGAASVSDKNGQLLFYTDGITVWNRNNAVMFNGIGLAGGTGSSTQSCIIVPKTSDEKQYYIFTTDEESGPKGLEYSVVDMTLNNGLGDVTLKNQPLVTPVSEKVTAVRHCNKKDYWVITHKIESDAYYAYLVTANGVDPNPVVSHTGSYVPTGYFVMSGALKSSPDGKKLVAVHKSIGVDLSDFDNQTGVVSNTTEIFQYTNALHYGAEFSANSKMLYVAIHGYWWEPDLVRYSGVFQYDLSLPTIQDIINSKNEIFRHTPYDAGSSLQRGPDGKIYMTNYEKFFLSVINNPEVYGVGCNFTEMGVTLPSMCEASLPNLISDYSTSIDSFRVTSTGTCVNIPVTYDYNATGDVTGLLWDFGDPASGVQNNSTINNPSHTFSSSGSYTVKLIKYSPCGNDTLSKQIDIGDLQVSLGSDTSFCEGSNYIISPQASGVTSYMWQDGSVSQNFLVTAAGLYWVEGSNSSNGCKKRDSVILTTKPLPTVNLGMDTAICAGSSIQLNAFLSGAQYLWQDNSTNSFYQVNAPGNYRVELNLNGCLKRDSITITGLNKPQFSLGPDQVLCPGLSLTLSPDLNNVTYEWQDGSTNHQYLVQSPGLYYVDITNICGTTGDSIKITGGDCKILIPTAFTPNNDGLNDRFSVLGTGLVNNFDFRIYDRGGQLIFETKDKNGYWNGEYKGKKLSTGVYVYLIIYDEINTTEKKILKGTVLLIR